MLQKRKTRKNFTPFPIHVKTGDTVMVISGKDKGKTGVVKRVFQDRGRVLVEGVNFIVKATRPNPAAGVEGGLIKMEAPLFASKVMLYDTQAGKPTRIRHSIVDGKKTRVSTKSDLKFDV
jgi:large subunit ribosomal protein L24